MWSSHSSWAGAYKTPTQYRSRIFQYYVVLEDESLNPQGNFGVGLLGSACSDTIVAQCVLCGSVVKASRRVTSNLITHLKRKHPNNYDEFYRTQMQLHPHLTFQPPYPATSTFRMPSSSTSQPSATVSYPLPSSSSSSSSPSPSPEQAANQTVQISTTNSPPLSVISQPIKTYARSTPPSATSTASTATFAQALGATNLLQMASIPGALISNALSSIQPTDPTNPSALAVQMMSSLIDQSIINERQSKITDALVNLVAGQLLSPAIVDSPQFVQLMKIIDSRYVTPSSPHLVETIVPHRCLLINSKLQEFLTYVPNVCLGVDMWTDMRLSSWLGITAHFIYKWRLYSVLLGCKQLRGELQPDEICKHYEEVLSMFNLECKVSHVTTGNFSGWLKHFKTSLPGLAQDQGLRDSEIEEVDVSFLPRTLRNYASALQDVIKDGLRGAENMTDLVCKATNLIPSNEVNNVINKLRDAKTASETSHSWAMQLKLLQYVLTTVGDDSDSEDSCRINLTKQERLALGEMIEILEPFQEAIHFVQNEQCVSIGSVVPCIRGLKHHLRELSIHHGEDLVANLKDAIEVHLSTYERDELFRMAAMVDPRFKLQWATDETESSQMRGMLVERANRRSLHPDDSVKIETSEFEPEPSESGPKLFRFMKKSTAPVVSLTPALTKVMNEVREYLSEPCLTQSESPLAYWKNASKAYPSLSCLAEKVMAIPAASAVFRDMFSIEGKLIANEAGIPTHVFENLMLIRCNAKYPYLNVSTQGII